MASKNTLNVVDGDSILIDILCEEMGIRSDVIDVLQDFSKHGVIAVESLLEMAISKVGKLERSNADGEDFVDGSDAKKGIATTNDNKTGGRSCTISNLKNKRGLLRVVISDPLTGHAYFFKIPPEEYTGKNYIKIMFSKNGGEPDSVWGEVFNIVEAWKTNQTYEVKEFSNRMWTKYQVKTFKELCG